MNLFVITAGIGNLLAVSVLCCVILVLILIIVIMCSVNAVQSFAMSHIGSSNRLLLVIPGVGNRT